MNIQRFPNGTWESNSQMDKVRYLVATQVMAPLDMDELPDAIPDATDYMKDLERREFRELLSKAFHNTSCRERILCLQWAVEGLTINEIAKKHGISRERVRQIIAGGFLKMQNALYRLGYRPADRFGYRLVDCPYRPWEYLLDIADGSILRCS